MIVNINNDPDKYLELFTEAYEFLKGITDENYVDPNRDRFTSLAEYYGHIADLFDEQAYRYVMVPLDEDPFEINLNTREIVVPKSFNKCASIQTDLLAETIVFVCDRYFDFMDLANTNIYVQWTTPDGFPGATRVEMIDIESTPDKIKFAWPLNDAVTKMAGKVKFSVRFFRINDKTDELVYSLNTSDAEIIIKPALQPNGPTIVETPVSDDTFRKAIVNSLYAEDGVSLPVYPIYSTPGNDIQPTVDGNMINVDGVNIVSLENDTITLYVQAIAADAGEIRYEWYYKPEGGEVFYNCEEYPTADGLSTMAFGTVSDYYRPISGKERVKHERYYQQEGNGYKLYTGEFPAEIPLFEKCSAYTVHATGEVTGHYHAQAWNQIRTEKGKVLETLYPVASSDCLLPGPRDVKITTDLRDGVIFTTEVIDEEEGLEIHKTTLGVTILEDSYEPTITYEWRKSTSSETEVLNEETEIISTEPTLTVTDEPGWYSVKVTSTLNRKHDYEFSNVCKVTHKPVPPVVEQQQNNISYPVKTKPQTLTVEASIVNENNLGEKLLSDEIIYVWQKNIPNNGDKWITLTEKDKGVSGVGTKSLTITNEISNDPVITFRCLVINELNGEKAIFDHSGSYVPNENEYLGEFKNEAPYIYDSELKHYAFIVTNI